MSSSSVVWAWAPMCIWASCNASELSTVRRHQWLQHDGVPAHRAQLVQNFFNITGTQVLPHPGYSPDLTLSDFWLFTHVKHHIRGQRFNSMDHLHHSVDTVIGMITAAEYHHALHSLPQCW